MVVGMRIGVSTSMGMVSDDERKVLGKGRLIAIGVGGCVCCSF